MFTWRTAAGILLLTTGITASAFARQAEPTAAAFLDIDVSGRSAAMAGTGVSAPTPLSAIYSNPAGLSGLLGQRAGMLHASWFQGLSLEWAGYGAEVGHDAGAAVAATFLRSDPLPRYNEFGDLDGDFRVYDAALSVGYGRRVWRNVRAGLTVKGIHQNLDDISGTGFAADLGLLSSFGPAVVGASLQNAGPDMTIDGDAFPLPTTLLLGGAYPTWEGRVLFTGGLTFPQHYYDDARVGVEIRPNAMLALRTGYRYVFEQGTKDELTGMTYGAGFLVGGVEIDYAYQPFDELGDTHRLGVAVAFDRGVRTAAPTRAPTVSRRPADAAPAVPKDVKSDAPRASTPASAPAKTAAPPTKAEPAVAAGTPPVAAPETPPNAAPTKRIEGPAAVVAGTHKTRFSALEELRMLRISGYRGGEVHRLDDGRYQVLVKTFKNGADAQSWIDGPGREYGNLGFSIIELR